MQRLFKFMEEYLPVVPQEVKDFMEKHSIIIDYENGDFYMSPEDSKPYWNFVVKGLVENYTIDGEGNKRIKWFTSPNQLFLGTKHLYTKRNENLFIKFARPTLCIQISNERMKEAKEKFTEVSELIHILREQFMHRYKEYIEVLLTPGCTPQVEKFIEKFPALYLKLDVEQLSAHLNKGTSSIYRALNEISLKKNK